MLPILMDDRIMIDIILNRFSVEKTDEEIFYNICFCICAPQTTFVSNMKVNQELKNRGFYNKEIGREELREIVKPVRFLRKADFLLKVKDNFYGIMAILDCNISSQEKRRILVKVVAGFGMKAASHFLRNCGVLDLAIIDTHVLKFLGCETPKNEKEYLEIEEKFKKEAERKTLPIAGLDAYIWKIYSNTEWEDYKY